MRTLYLIISIILIIVGPAVLLYGHRVENGYSYQDQNGQTVWQKGSGLPGIFIQLVGAVAIWVSAPLGIYSLVVKGKTYKFSKKEFISSVLQLGFLFGALIGVLFAFFIAAYLLQALQYSPALQVIAFLQSFWMWFPITCFVLLVLFQLVIFVKGKHQALSPYQTNSQVNPS